MDGVSFSLERGRTLGIVGESGSGKSVTSLGIMGLHHGTSAQISGHIRLDGEDLVARRAGRVRELRGSKMAMIFQDPLSSLHPYYTVGHQIIEAYRVHNEVSKKAAREHAVDLLDRVGIPQPAARVDDYPHQFSGGMRQRAMIAMALSCDPGAADRRRAHHRARRHRAGADPRPDLATCSQEFGSAVIIITHDLGVVAELSDDILVMYAGRVAEYGAAADIFGRPGHPYTWGLLARCRAGPGAADRLVPIPGTPPSLIKVPSGCPFHPRCRYAGLTDGRAHTEVPAAARGRNARSPGGLPPDRRGSGPAVGRAAPRARSRTDGAGERVPQRRRWPA